MVFLDDHTAFPTPLENVFDRIKKNAVIAVENVISNSIIFN